MARGVGEEKRQGEEEKEAVVKYVWEEENTEQ